MTLSRFVCKNCGEVFFAYYQTGHKARIYCNKKCQYIDMKNFRHSKESIEKIRLKKLGKKRGPLSKEWKEKIGESNKETYRKGRKQWNNGLTKETDERVKKISIRRKDQHNSPTTEFKKGLIPWNKDTKGIVKAWNKNKPNPMLIKLNKDPEFQKKRLKGLCKKPTKPERIVIEIIKKHRLSFDYVGNGSFIIENLNPDFVSNKKEIIEVFGRFWHETYKNVDEKRTGEGRKKIFAQQGYKTLILWDDELENSSEQEILNKIKNFQEVK